MAFPPVKAFPTLKELDRIVADWVAEGGLEELEAEQTPKPDGTCKEKGCGGRVVRKVAGGPPNGISYWDPACEKCSRQYPFAKSVPLVGAEEYIKSLRTPTI